MGYAIDGKAVSEEDFFRHQWGDQLVDLMLEGGYLPIRGGTLYELGEKALRWRDGARGLDWQLSKLFPPAWNDARPLHHISPSFDDAPAFIHGRVTVQEKQDRERVGGGYRDAYEAIRERFGDKDGDHIAPSLIGGLRALRECIREELDHRAVRAAQHTDLIPQYLAVPFAEAAQRIKNSGDRKGLHRLHVDIEVLWQEFRQGHLIPRTLRHYDQAGKRWSDLGPESDLPMLWEVQRGVIENLLRAREEELSIAEKLEYRYHACRLLLRATAVGTEVLSWNRRNRLGHLDPLLQLGYHLRRDELRRLTHEHKARREGRRADEWEDYTSSLKELARWAQEKGIRSASVMEKHIRESGYWEGRGKGTVDRSAVEDLVARLIHLSHQNDRHSA